MEKEQNEIKIVNENMEKLQNEIKIFIFKFFKHFF